MSIPRLAIVLLTSLAVMLSVVVLRSEQTRYQYKLSEQDRKIDVLSQEIREKELELARLSSPWVIRQRLQDLRLERAASTQPAAGAAPRKDAARPASKRRAREASSGNE